MRDSVEYREGIGEKYLAPKELKKFLKPNLVEQHPGAYLLHNGLASLAGRQAATRR